MSCACAGSGGEDFHVLANRLLFIRSFLPADPSLRRPTTDRPQPCVAPLVDSSVVLALAHPGPPLHTSLSLSLSRRRCAASQPARVSSNAHAPRKSAMEATSSRRPGHSPRAPPSVSPTPPRGAEFSSSTKPHRCHRSGDRLVACCLLPGSLPARRRTTLFGERTTE